MFKLFNYSFTISLFLNQIFKFILIRMVEVASIYWYFYFTGNGCQNGWIIYRGHYRYCHHHSTMEHARSQKRSFSRLPSKAIYFKRFFTIQFFFYSIIIVLCLIILPFGLYLFYFWLHFTILNESGTGDAFMSTKFQTQLKGSSLTKNSVRILFIYLIF